MMDIIEDCERPILIGGCGSSGTTLLQSLLTSHSKVAGGPEMSVFDRPRVYDMGISDFYNRWESEALSVFDEGCLYPISFDGGGSTFAANRDEFNPEKVVRHIFADPICKTVRDFWSKFFTAYARRNGKAIWCEKSPNNVYCIEQFLEWFPHGRFINVLRDGRDVVASLVQTRGFVPIHAMYRWLTAVNAWQRSESDARVFCVRYENLVKFPAPHMRLLLNWLGLEWEPNAFNESEVHQDSVGRWLKMDDFAKRQLSLMFDDKLFELGYQT